VYARTPDETVLEPGAFVVIPTRYGVDAACVVCSTKMPSCVKNEDIVIVRRRLSDADMQKRETLKTKATAEGKIFQEKAVQHNLIVKLVAAHHLFDELKLLFLFSANTRIDFRELVKDLTTTLRTRVELWQISARDKAQIIGGVGMCGRSFCCCAISNKLNPVSTRMAKTQNLSLSSAKISGACNKLRCCLSHEYEWYEKARSKLPSEGLRLDYDGTNFRIAEINLVKQTIQMRGKDGRVLEVPSKRFVRDDNVWAIR
ncbi:PSP1 domain-containing protein, partial [Treponema endosymbiont of Eucomonympha sp.]|uniref:PSP1 domain-containing protein n=1 Tax=Treponema endosymbiont of Eucomonympha sp. TaxID=1580831 RepID=UPI000751017C